MGQDVHHGIEHYRRHGAGHADVGTEFHHAVGTAAETEGRGVAEGEARHGDVGLSEEQREGEGGRACQDGGVALCPYWKTEY